jgi:hypothetical protein
MEKMSRPETMRDVQNRMIQIASFELNLIAANPALMKHYVGLIEYVQKNGGEVKTSYGNSMTIFILRNRDQLQDQLRSEQYDWDDCERLYNLASVDIYEVKEYQRSRIKTWAKEEGLPDPFEESFSIDS